MNTVEQQQPSCKANEEIQGATTLAQIERQLELPQPQASNAKYPVPETKF